MMMLRSTMLALAGAFMLSGAALAQGEGMSLRESQLMFITQDGRVMMRMMTDKAALDALVKKGRPLTAGQMVVMSGGKLFIVDDVKMPSGKMMSEEYFTMSAN